MGEAWHVYIVKCADATLYTGVTKDLQRRLQQHNGEQTGGPKYTRGRRPVCLMWSKEASDHGAALQREIAIKKLSRREKLRLIGNAL
ncbi:MAG: GIY-YIG nuclease family protein [Halioglobus sp.]|nr:GIY-YIG nuclease family protein [Halioglobus sp.]